LQSFVVARPEGKQEVLHEDASPEFDEKAEVPVIGDNESNSRLALEAIAIIGEQVKRASNQLCFEFPISSTHRDVFPGALEGAGSQPLRADLASLRTSVK